MQYIMNKRGFTMEKEKKRLTAAQVKSLRHSGTKGPDKYYDENGLILRVMPTGGKQFLWAGTLRGKRTSFGLGGFPVVTLRQARETALDYKRKARKGEDPRPEHGKKNIPTFEKAAERCFKLVSSEWTEINAKRWWASLRDHVFPVIGEIRVDQVNGGDVLACLEPLWAEKNNTARKIRQRIGKVMQWAIAQNFRADNPAGTRLRRFCQSRTGKHIPRAKPCLIPKSRRHLKQSGIPGIRGADACVGVSGSDGRAKRRRQGGKVDGS